MYIDLTTLTDEQLDAERIAILTEQERRANLAAIPTQIADLSRAYQQGGGDPDVLVNAVTHAPDPEPEQIPE